MADLPPGDHPEADEATKTPRPPNSWILYRTAKSQKLRAQAEQAFGSADGDAAPVRRRQADISRTISHMWKTEPKEVKDRYAALAEEKRLEHERRYPPVLSSPLAPFLQNYRYQPRRQRPNNSSSGSSIGEASSSSNPRPRHRRFTTTSETDDPRDFSSTSTQPQETLLSSYASSSRGVTTPASDLSRDPLPPPSFIRASSWTAPRGLSDVEPRGLSASATGAQPYSPTNVSHHHQSGSVGDVPAILPFRFAGPMFASDLTSRSEPTSASSLPRSFMQHDQSIAHPHSGPTARVPSVLASSYPSMLASVPPHVASPHGTMPEWAPVGAPSSYWSHGNEAPRMLHGSHPPPPNYPAASIWGPERVEEETHPPSGEHAQPFDGDLSHHGFSGLPGPPPLDIGPSSLPSWFAPSSAHPPTQPFMQSDTHAAPSSQRPQLDARSFAEESRRRMEQSRQPHYSPHQGG